MLLNSRIAGYGSSMTNRKPEGEPEYITLALMEQIKKASPMAASISRKSAVVREASLFMGWGDGK